MSGNSTQMSSAASKMMSAMQTQMSQQMKERMAKQKELQNQQKQQFQKKQNILRAGGQNIIQGPGIKFDPSQASLQEMARQEQQQNEALEFDPFFNPSSANVSHNKNQGSTHWSDVHFEIWAFKWLI